MLEVYMLYKAIGNGVRRGQGQVMALRELTERIRRPRESPRAAVRKASPVAPGDCYCLAFKGS
jgi:hypothetical protein